MTLINTLSNRSILLAIAVWLAGCSSSTTTDSETLSLFLFQADSIGSEQQLSTENAPLIGFESDNADSDTGQWFFEPAGQGYVFLLNQATGQEFVLGVVEDGVLNRLAMQARNESAGQRWLLIDVGEDRCRLHTELLGMSMSLTAIESDTTTTVEMQVTDTDSAAQHWQISPLGADQALCL